MPDTVYHITVLGDSEHWLKKQVTQKADELFGENEWELTHFAISDNTDKSHEVGKNPPKYSADATMVKMEKVEDRGAE